MKYIYISKFICFDIGNTFCEKNAADDVKFRQLTRITVQCRYFLRLDIFEFISLLDDQNTCIHRNMQTVCLL